MVVAPGMVDLHGAARSALLDCFRQTAQPGNELVAVGADVARHPRELVDGGIADADQPGATAGPFGVEFNQPVGHLEIAAHIHVHRRHQDPAGF